MRYSLSKYTRVIPCDNSDNLIIFNSFNGSQSYVFDADIKAQIKSLQYEPMEGAKINDALKVKYCVEDGIDENELVINAIDKSVHTTGALKIIIIPTTDCNFSCVYCYEKKEHGFISDETMDNLYKAIVHFFASAESPMSLQLDWFGGEPMLYYDKLLSFCCTVNQFCREHSIAYQHSITTNGYLLTTEKAKQLIENGVNLFQITVDGMSTTHDQYRHLIDGSPTWQKIIDNLLALKSLDDNFKVQLRINYNMDIVASLESFFDFFVSSFGGDHRFDILFHAIGHWGGENDCSVNIISPEYQSFVMCELMRAGVERGVTNFVPYIPHCGAELCYANMEHSYVIYKNGLIGKCTLEESPDIESDFVIGDINQGYFYIDPEKEKKWISSKEDYQAYVKQVGCEDCISFPICGGISCPAVRVRNGSKGKKCTPTMACIDELIKMNYELSKGAGNQ